MTAHVHPLAEMPLKEELPGVRKRVLIGAEHGARKFYLRHYDIAPGLTTPLDQHIYEHEFFVLNGTGSYLCDGQTVPIKAGDAIWVQSNQVHQITNTGQEPLQILCCRGAEEIYK